MECVAKYDFVATAPDELSFRKGEVLKVGLSVSLLPYSIILLIFRCFIDRFIFTLILFTEI